MNLRKFLENVGFYFLFVWSSKTPAKDLYMTVFRDYGSEEIPEIDINYRNQSPFHFRVLKPKNMELFISQQIDLKRAWKRPKTEINTMRILKVGLNSLQWRTDWLRRTVNPTIRTRFAESYGGGQYASGITGLDEGHQRLVAYPDDFDLISEFVVYPEGVDQTLPFDVPGFNQWFNSYNGGFKTKSIALPKLKPGFYLVQVTQGPLEGQVILVVNDLIAEIQQSDSTALVHLADRRGRPVPQAFIEVRNIQGEWKLNQNLSENGATMITGLPPGPLIYHISDRARKLGSAIIDAEFLSSSIDYPDFFLFGDRPIYRPGDEIQVKGIIRKSWDGLSRLFNIFPHSESKVTVHLTNTEGEPKSPAVSSSLTDFGTFHASLTVPKTESGVLRILGHFSNQDHVGEIRVQDYIKPIYFLTTETKQETLKAGETLKVDVTMARFVGGSPATATLRADLYRERYFIPEWAETSQYHIDHPETRSPTIPLPVASIENIKLDKLGRAVVEIQLPHEVPGDPHYDYHYRLNIFASDQTGESASKSLTFLDTRSSVIAEIRHTPLYIKKNSSSTITVFSLSPSGEPLGHIQGNIKWSLATYRQEKKDLLTTDFITEKDGKIALPIPTSGAGELEALVTMTDHKGAKTTQSSKIYVFDPSSESQMVPVNELTLLTNHSQVRAQEQPELLVLLPQKWGINGSTEGYLHVTLAGKKIYSSKKISARGHVVSLKVNIEPHFDRNFYVLVSYPDPNRGWVERRMGFSVFPEDKLLRVSMDFSNKELTPQGEQTAFFKVSDYRGKPVAAEITLSVVDEAVYRLQDEFRPSLVEFFYPRQRLNLMTFVSHHFQSYGYGESLAALFNSNFSFGSPKSEKAKLDRDTAYWNPSILTREDGTAEVSFKLPTNQTIWRATAVAVDRNGSFGESKGFFRANRAVSLITSWPRSLRPGDEVGITMRVIASEKAEKTPFKIDFLASDVVPLSANSIFEGNVNPGQEMAIPVRFKMTGKGEEKTDQIKALLKTASQSSEYHHTIQRLSNAFRFNQSINFDDKNQAFIPVAEEEETKNLTIHFASGLSGTLSQAARHLILYPYGCAEQLSSSIVVNFMNTRLIRGDYTRETIIEKPLLAWWGGLKLFAQETLFKTKTLHRDKLKSPQGKSKEKLIAASQQFYTAGLQRLKQYQNDDGSLAWWPGMGRGDLPMTLYVLYALTVFPDLDRNLSIDILKAWRWLEKQPIPQDAPENIFRLAIYAQLVKQGLLDTPSDQHESLGLWRFLSEKTLKSTDSLEKLRHLSWIVLGLHDTGLAQRPSFRATTTELVSALSNLFRSHVEVDPRSQDRAKLLERNPSFDSWIDYPGTGFSTIALAGRALHTSSRLSLVDQEKMVQVVSRAFDGQRFLSTFETAHILMNSEYILRSEGQFLSDLYLRPDIFIEDKQVNNDTIRWETHVGGFSASVPLPALAPGSRRISFQDLPPHMTPSAYVEKMTSIDQLKPYFSPWTLKRRLYKILLPQNQLVAIRPENIQLGDILYVELDIGPGKDSSPSAYLLVDDSVPSGLIPLMEDRVFIGPPWNLPLRPKIPFKREFLVDRVRFHLQKSPRQTESHLVFGYLVRAAFQGQFQGGFTKVEDMYQDKNYSHLGNPSITVGRL